MCQGNGSFIRILQEPQIFYTKYNYRGYKQGRIYREANEV